jgi:Cft2 family RNA processing exonuclease
MIEYKDGIHLKSTDLWFDAKRKVPLSFISNAGFNKFGPHKKIIATPQTIRLLGKKIRNSVVLACPFNRPFSLGRVQVELLPSGAMLGSSQISVDFDGKKLVYTGDLRLRSSVTSEQAVPRHCDILVIKCTYGLPNYIFPPTEDVMESIMAFIDDSFSSGHAPVILVNHLGSAQELVKVLGSQGYNLSLHKSIFDVIKVYEEFGVDFLNYDSFDPMKIGNKVLVLPLSARDSDELETIEDKRIGVAIGWALDRVSVKSAFGADEAFPLSNHAGFDELIEFVEIVKPTEVYVVNGFGVEFSMSLKRRGFNAKPLEKPSQLKLL